MTYNHVDLTQPQAEDSVSYTIPSDDSAQLNFGSEDIAGLSVGDNGELIISFADGGQLIITNFEDFTNDGNFVLLADGIIIDPSVLTNFMQAPEVFNTADSMNADAIQIAQPAANTTQEIAMQSGQKYVCDFDPANAVTVDIKDGQMVLTFADGSQVVISNYSEVMAGELPPVLTLADGTVIDVAELLTQVTDIKDIENAEEDVANIEPAAGDEAAEEVIGEEDMAAMAEKLAAVQTAAGGDGAASNSGYGFNSLPSSAPLNSPDAIGPLGPTQLAYSAPEVQGDNPFLVDDRPVISSAEESLDETNLLAGNLVATGTLNVSYGNDGPGSILPNGMVTPGGSLANNVLSSSGVPVVFTQTIDGYIGEANGVTVFTFEIDSVSGEYTYTQILPFDNADATDDNDVITIDFGVVAIDDDGDRTATNIRINVADDAPVVLSQIAKTVDETDMVAGTVSTTGQFFTDVGQDVAGTYAGTNQFNASGSLTGGTLTSNGVAVVVTLDAATNTYTGTAGTTTVFTLAIDPATGQYTFNLTAPLDHADGTDPNDEIILEFGASITDFDGDTETGTLTVKVLDDGPQAVDDTFTPGSATPYAGRVFDLDVLANDHFSQDGVNIISDATFINGTAFTLANYEDFVSAALYGGPTHTSPILAKSAFIDLMNQFIADGAEFEGLVSLPSGAYALFNYGDKLEVLTVGTKWHVVSELKVEYTLLDGDGDTSTAVASTRTYHTPLVLDLDGDGIELLNAVDGVQFDMDMDGDTEQTGWVDADDGLLALDKNGDGIINDRSELFGDTDGFTDGFDNLSSYDGNGDGVIDVNDDIYEDLRVWQDLNSDGVTDEGELLTLADLGIVSIFLNADMPDDLHIEGNWISHVSSYTTSDGETHEIVDAWFQSGDESDTLSAVGGQADEFVFQTIAESAVTIQDFNVAEGDLIDLSLLIEAQSDITDAINDFVYVVEENGATIVSVDVDGAEGPAEAVEVAKLEGVTGMSAEDLVDSSNIIV